MRTRTARLVRGGLAALVLAIVAAVGWTVSRPGRPGAAASAEPPPAREEARVDAFVHRTFKGDKESLVIRAQSYEGREQEEQRLRGVEVTVAYTAKGEPGKAVITADHALYTEALQKAVFQGNVHMVTDDGFDLKTTELVWRGDKHTARSDQPVAFSRQNLSGTAKGFTYESETRQLQLLAEVKMRTVSQGKPPMDITSASAEVDDEAGLARFLRDVEVLQGPDRLVSDRLILNFEGEPRSVYRAQAIDEVQLWTGGGSALPGVHSPTSGQGPRHLMCRRLDMWFRPDGSLQQALAGPRADLTMTPAPGEEQEKRRLRSDVLTFTFDGQGRLEELQALKDTVFTGEPIPPAKGEPRRLNCKRLVAKLDAESGQPAVIEFINDVEFTRGRQKARAERAFYDGAKKALTLRDDPVVIDEEAGSELRAKVIEVQTESGDLAAREDVRHVLRGRGTGSGLLGGGAEPTVVAASTFNYTSRTKVAVYQQDAILRSGRDEVRAAQIRIQEKADGKRRLEAESRVVMRMQPKPKEGAAQPLMHGRAGEMTYDDNKIVYTGDVVLKQGEIETRSPKATLELSDEGTAVKSLVAGEPVEVLQGGRRATGARATYMPDSGTMVMVGDSVVLTDASGRVEGRTLTFHVGDDRVLVDGREEVRTRMILKQQTRQ